MLTLTVSVSTEPKASIGVISGNSGIQIPPKPKYKGAKPQQKLATETGTTEASQL